MGRSYIGIDGIDGSVLFYLYNFRASIIKDFFHLVRGNTNFSHAQKLVLVLQSLLEDTLYVEPLCKRDRTKHGLIKPSRLAKNDGANSFLKFCQDVIKDGIIFVEVLEGKLGAERRMTGRKIDLLCTRPPVAVRFELE